MRKNKLIYTHIPMGRCDVVVYAGKPNNRTIVYRQQIQFDPEILSKGIRGLISSEDLLAYKQNTINEYVVDVDLTLKKNVLINPEIFVEFNSYKDEESDISNEDIFNELVATQKSTPIILLKEKINKHFGE